MTMLRATSAGSTVPQLSLGQRSRGVVGHIWDVPRLALLGAIWVYQSTLGPALPPSCRFEPSCSRYAYTAIQRHGALRGGWLALRRLGRCHPLGGSGYDPVP